MICDGQVIKNLVPFWFITKHTLTSYFSFELRDTFELLHTFIKHVYSYATVVSESFGEFVSNLAFSDPQCMCEGSSQDFENGSKTAIGGF